MSYIDIYLSQLQWPLEKATNFLLSLSIRLPLLLAYSLHHTNVNTSSSCQDRLVRYPDAKSCISIIAFPFLRHVLILMKTTC